MQRFEIIFTYSFRADTILRKKKKLFIFNNLINKRVT